MAGLVSIHIAPEAGAPMESVPRVRAVPERGLEGDRYFEARGTYSRKPGPDREVTLIEREAIEALARDYGIDVPAGEVRRNLVVEGVALNHLVGKEFRVGEVVLRGVRLCEPCRHLEGLVGKDVVPGLVHRGGLRASVVRGGTVRVGDAVAILG